MLWKTVEGTDGRKYRFVAKEGTYEELTQLGTKVRGHIPGTDSPFYGFFDGDTRLVLESWLTTFRVANKIPVDDETINELVDYFLPVVENKRADRSVLLYVIPE